MFPLGGYLPNKMNEAIDKTSWKEVPILIIKGFFMGCADIVPGVSGGTIAFIMGIYKRFLWAITSFNVHALKNIFTCRFGALLQDLHWKFMLSIITGIGIAIIFFTQIIPLANLIFSYPTIIFGLFFGLIVGSIILLIRYYPLSQFKQCWWLLLGALLGNLMFLMEINHTPNSPWFIFLSGALAICRNGSSRNIWGTHPYCRQ